MRVPRRLARVGAAADLPDAAAFDAYVGPAGEIVADVARGIIALQDGVTPGGGSRYEPGGGGSGLPDGGSTGFVLVKASNDDGDGEWVAPFSRAAGFLFGLTLSNNTTDANNDIDIASGSCRSIEDDSDIVLSSALTKRLDASWAVGTGNGGLDTGTKANSTAYHVWAIRRPDTGVVDVLFSTSATNPVMPANYTQKRRIGAVLTDGSGNIRQFIQNGSRFTLLSPVLDVNVTDQGDSPTTRTLTVPTGVRVVALLRVRSGGAASASFQVVHNDGEVSSTPGASGNADAVTSTSVTIVNNLERLTNTSGQVRTRSSTAGTTFVIATYGWIDHRDATV